MPQKRRERFEIFIFHSSRNAAFAGRLVDAIKP
jgi:hypothetical protein